MLCIIDYFWGFVVVLFKINLFYFMCMNVLPACVSANHMCVWCPQKKKKRALDPLGLELQMVLSHHVGTEN